MIRFPSVYRLIPRPDLHDSSLCSLRLISSQERSFVIYLPLSSDTIGYFLFTSFSKSWNFYSENLIIDKIGPLKGCFFWLRSLFVFGRDNKLCFGENRIFAYGSRRAKRSFLKSNRHMRIRGLPFDGNKIHNFPQLLYGWDDSIAKNIDLQIATKARIAIVVHIYYVDRWMEIANLLSGLGFTFDLYISLVRESSEIRSEILRRFSCARVYVMDNYGRDIRPFLVFLEEGKLDKYDYICKIHAKKSRDGRHSWWEGDLWRRWIFFDLLGASGVALKIIETFDRCDTIGMIGSRAYRYPNNYFAHDKAWGKNYSSVLSIARKMGILSENCKLDFFGGTMFWVRRKALDPIKYLGLSKDFASNKNESLDGNLEHAIERCFSLSVMQMGLCLGDVDCILGTSSSQMPQISISET
ncbi:rhamnan synthesis F family protein [Candidatus Liberibacter sp.]|uniref:rhamnan synthesis F family protein n=1 Tax=Candidatus Liberibacter sp. TaxID=34022 RepID=UPI0015F652C3|nr:rhamnan synthesis F family protein [Candidatus Liberibacter sp.]MBA5723739.1 hypothetical protein [Candidatus Liberibacter sp.]